MVNDASTDGTEVILQQMARTDDRLRILHYAKNMGLDYARFSGVNAAKGRYLCFLDADDTLPRNAISSLLSVAEREDADIVEGASTRVLGRWGLVKRRSHLKNQVLVPPELMDDYFISYFGVNRLGVTAWGKLYLRDLFVRSSIRPSGFKRGQDLVMNMSLFPYVRKYVTLDEDVLHYYFGGITSSLDRSFYDCSKQQYYMKLDMINRYGYTKALRTTRIEMCNILNTMVRQMLLARLPEAEIRLFLEEEVSSGFLDEISLDTGNSINLDSIKNKNIGGIIDSQRRSLWKARLRRSVSLFVAKIL